jgi:hypothetical protein
MCTFSCLCALFVTCCASLLVQAGAVEAAVAQPRLHAVLAQPPLAEMQLQLEATRREAALLQANQRQPEDVRFGQHADERDRAAAARAEDQRIASSHQELQEAWRSMVDELKEQLQVT